MNWWHSIGATGATVFEEWSESIAWALKFGCMCMVIAAALPIIAIGWIASLIFKALRAGWRMADDTIEWFEGLSL